MSPPGRATPFDRGDRLWQVVLLVAFVGVSAVLLTPSTGAVELFPFADKLVHVALFAGLAVLSRQAYPHHPVWGVVLALALYGGAVEFAQRNVEGRAPEALDWVADVLGALAAFAWRPMRRRKSKPL